MPRNTTVKKTAEEPQFRVVSPRAAPVPVYPSPSLGSILAQSVSSGIGSGVGFGLGSSLVRSFFGSTPAPVTEVSDYMKCLEANKFTESESNCYHLSDSYKACMIRTNFNRGECSRDM
jgi:hypothetical protein